MDLAILDPSILSTSANEVSVFGVLVLLLQDWIASGYARNWDELRPPDEVIDKIGSFKRIGAEGDR